MKDPTIEELFKNLKEVLAGEWQTPPGWYEENLQKLKDVIDRSPRKFLDQHLLEALANEWYELAGHIQKRRNLLDQCL